MAKKIVEKVEPLYPSRFGSHQKMVVEDIDNQFVTCKDEHGLYKTERKRLDNGFADCYRYDRQEAKQDK